MKAPSFFQLARIDERHFITACRHGLVHVTWGRATVRFSRDEFRHLTGLLEQAADVPPSSARDHGMRVTSRLDDDCELEVGSLVFLLTPSEFRALVEAAREAVRRLDKILASGVWDRKDDDDDAPPNALDQLRRIPFSHN